MTTKATVTSMDEPIPYIPRLLSPSALLSQKSHFLLGPRQTGKTSLVVNNLSGVRVYDLHDTSVYLSLSRNPGRLSEELQPHDRFVVIDEIQRLPDLLHEVHRLIEKTRVRFLLTGSSARKLRRGGVNLLGGRARVKYLFPFVRAELGTRFDLDRALNSGLLPSIYLSANPAADLEAYAGTYLQQEVVAEGSARNIPAFSRFLRIAALCNGTVVNFTNVANDAQVPRTTVYEYFEVLKDTLILHEMPAWQRSTKRKPLVSSKFYFFDTGVTGFLQGRRFASGTGEYGAAFETYIAHELRAYREYHSGDALGFWRSASGFEVDFVLGDHTAIEVKAKQTIGPQDLKALVALSEEKKLKRYICVSLEPRRRTTGAIHILPYEEFLDALWEGEFT
ncbi:MAG: ATP-binding protein [Ignavibacteria bacterium]|nr:ATP-binding protein [Ignavibacteria bacterium]